MPSKLLAAALLTATAALAPVPVHLVAAEFQKDASFSDNDQARDLLAEGVKEFRAGRYKAAAAAFNSALKLNPDNQVVYHWYLAAGDALVVQMEGYDELSEVLKDTLRRARIYQRELRTSPKYIELLMGKLAASEEERVVATLELIAVGPLAVPQLLGRLGEDRQDELRAHCRAVLTRMGGRAVLPLTESLKSADKRLLAGAATVLADIGDARALPRLTALAQSKDLDGTTRLVVERAISAIREASGLKDLSASPEAQFFAEAQRYFRGGERVHDEMMAGDVLVWRWKGDEADPLKRLAYVKVPRYAWNELMAEQLLFDGLALNPAAPSYQPLLAAVLAAEVAETDARLAAAKERTTPIQNPDEDPAAIGERVAKLQEQILRVRMAGGHLFGALAESIAAERSEVAALVMRQLQDRWLARADLNLPIPGAAAENKAGSVLVAALDHGDKTVRYQAAITLAHLDPAVAFANADKVVGVLSDAVGEWGARVVLVVEADWRYRNAARDHLQAKGYLTYTASDGFDAMQRLDEAPIKDAIVVSGDLSPWLKDEKGRMIDLPQQSGAALALALLDDPRVGKTPVFVALPEDPLKANALQKTLETATAERAAANRPGAVAGFVRKPYAAVDLDNQIQAGLVKSEIPNANRSAAEDVALRACIALQQPDPARTQFDLGRAAETLIKTLDARSDAVRIEALKALANAAQGRSGDRVRTMVGKLTDVYAAQDGELKPALRAAFLLAIGQLDPTTEPAQQIIAKALNHDDAQVRLAAAEAVGHALRIAPELLARFQIAQRLDVRDAGATKPGEQPAAQPAQ